MPGAVPSLMIACALPLLATPALAADADPKPTVVIGVRIDAPPFAWRNPDGGYSGFLYNLCLDAATRAKYPVRTVEITVADRAAFFAGKGDELTLLCDPTTITLARIAELRKLPAPQPEFSPIVFVANGSFVEQSKEDSPRKGSITAEEARALDCIPGPSAKDAKSGAAISYAAAGFVGATTAEGTLRDAVRSEVIELGPHEHVCLVEKATHWQAAEAFCAGSLRYYFGDEDILRSALRLTAENGHDCPDQPVSLPLSYEPYAFVIAGEPKGFRQDFVMALYATMVHEPAQDRFRRSFAGQRMSGYLETLFRILHIPAGEAPRDAPAATAAAAPDPARSHNR